MHIIWYEKPAPENAVDLWYRFLQCVSWVWGFFEDSLPNRNNNNTPLNPSHAGRYSIYLPWRDGRL